MNPENTERRGASGPDASDGEARYRTLFEHAPDAIVVFDLETGKFVEANENACNLFGYAREALMALGPVDVSPEFQPDGRASTPAAIEYLSAALQGESPAFEWMHVNSAGEPVECEIRLVRMPPYSRQLVRGSLVDIRGRRAAEAELARREREFRTLAENSPDWIVRLDPQLRRTYVNPAVLAASNSTLEQLVGKTPTESFPESPEMAAWEDVLRRCLESGEPATVERETNLGQSRILQTSVVPERD